MCDMAAMLFQVGAQCEVGMQPGNNAVFENQGRVGREVPFVDSVTFELVRVCVRCGIFGPSSVWLWVVR